MAGKSVRRKDPARKIADCCDRGGEAERRTKCTVGDYIRLLQAQKNLIAVFSATLRSHGSTL